MPRRLAAVAAATALLACGSPRSAELRNLMQATVVPASDSLFNAVVYTNGQLASSPQTDAQWQRLKAQVESLATAADRLRALAPASDGDEWVRQSTAMGTTALEAAAAVDARDLDGLLAAGSSLYNACTTCHAKYVPDLP